MIQRLSVRTVPEAADQADIAVRYQALLDLHATRQQARAGKPGKRRRAAGLPPRSWRAAILTAGSPGPLGRQF